MSQENSGAPRSAGEGAISQELHERLRQRESICIELENLTVTGDGSGFAAAIERAVSRYHAAPELPPEYGEILDKRFGEAERAARGRLAEAAERIRQSAKLDAECKALLAAGELLTLPEVETFEKKFRAFHAGDGKRIAEMEALLGETHARLAAEAAEAERLTAEAERLAAELRELTDAEEIGPLKDRKAAIDNEYKALGNVPHGAANRFKEAQRRASAKLSRHFETLDLARWESYTLKLDICAELEKLGTVPENELSAASKRLHELREKWKTLGNVPWEKNEEINPRYLELTRALQHRIDDYFAARRKEQKLAAEAKEELIKAAEALTASTEWGPTSGAFRELQAKWKALPRAGAADHELYSRFRAAADTFFNARNAAFAERDSKFKAAAEAKEALIREAENLTDPRRARALREEFRRLPGAGRREAELYRAFDAAMEKFFSARSAAFADKEKEARGLIAEVEKLAAAPLAALPRIREIRRRLDELNTRNTAAAEHAAFDAFDRALDAARSKEAGEKFALCCETVSELARRNAMREAGEALPEEAVANLELFPKAGQFARLLTAAAAGDAKAAEKIGRHFTAARAEYSEIVGEMEALAGIGGGAEAKSEPLSLAAELEAAITGNFARAEAKSAGKKKSTPAELRQRFLSAGVLPAVEFEEFRRRFEAAAEKLF